MSEVEVLKRAFLPEVLLPPDVSVALRVDERDALKMLEAGELGKTFRVGGTIGVLRSHFLNALKRRG